MAKITAAGLTLRPRYLKLSAFYFLYCAALGVYLAYWPLYLREIGFTAAAIGALTAGVLISKLLSAYVFGRIADRDGRVRTLQHTALGCALAFVLVSLSDTLWWVAGTMWLFGFFWGPLLSQLDAITIVQLGHAPHGYSRIRMWGSLGFIAGTVGGAPLIDAWGPSAVPALVAPQLFLLWLLSRRLPERRERRTAPSASLRRALTPAALCLFALCFMMQLAHGPYYAFFTLYMTELAYSKTSIGLLWGVAVGAEVGVFLIMHRLLATVAAPALLLFSMLTTAARWLLTAHFPDTAVIVFAQLLHAVSFGVYHAAAVHLLKRWFPRDMSSRAQALYAVSSFGLGGALGIFFAGQMWDSIGGAGVFMVSAALAFAGAALSLPLFPAARRRALS